MQRYKKEPYTLLYICTINLKKVKNKSQKVELTIPFSRRFDYAKVKNRKIIIKCTQKQYYDDMSAMIAWYKNKMFNL